MKRLFITIFVLFVIGIFAAPVFAADYEYQTTFKSSEWANMDHQQKLDATQISQNDLAEMDTDTLLSTVLDYPLLVDIFMFNSLEQGVDIVRNRFNGMDELLTRNDLGQAILDKYNSLSLRRDDTVGIKFMALDAMLSSSVVFDKLSKAQQNEIAEIMAQSVSLGGNRHFIDSGSEIDQAIMAVPTYVSTQNGSQVSAYIRGEELSASQISQINSEVAMAYPNAQRLRNATTNYNCHSYALFNTQALNVYWIPYPSYFLTDGSYVSVGSYPTAVNQRLYYPLSAYEHTAIITSYGSGSVINSSVICTSKWGLTGLYSHNATDCPYFVGGVAYQVYRTNY